MIPPLSSNVCECIVHSYLVAQLIHITQIQLFASCYNFIQHSFLFLGGVLFVSSKVCGLFSTENFLPTIHVLYIKRKYSRLNTLEASQRWSIQRNYLRQSAFHVKYYHKHRQVRFNLQRELTCCYCLLIIVAIQLESVETALDCLDQ